MMTYFLSCVTCPDSLAPDLIQMIDEAKGISLAEFKKRVCPRSLRIVCERLGYSEGSSVSLEADWAVRFKESHFCGIPVVFIDHSAIEYVFMEEDGQLRVFE